MQYARTARFYHCLEWLCFGTRLSQARTRHLSRLAPVEHALLIGEGNGAFLLPFVKQCPQAQVTVMDESQEMLDRARHRLLQAGCLSDRIEFTKADALVFSWPEAHYDFVASHFFFDNFNQAQVDDLIASINTSLRPAAQWLQVDFTLPANGWRHWRARLWLRILYTFWGMVAAVEVKSLPEVHTVLLRAEFKVCHTDSLCGGSICSTLYQRP